eukprot:scaffold64143_cov68-Attheya_sp.AAC.2
MPKRSAGTARVPWNDAPYHSHPLHIRDTNRDTEAYTRHLTIAPPKYMLLRTRFHVPSLTGKGLIARHAMPPVAIKKAQIS